MTDDLYLSRVRLRRNASMRALVDLLLGQDKRSRHAGHHLVWSLFADGPHRRRDFLWREMEPGSFLILSARRPEDQHALFDIDEPKPFAPALVAGDRLAFSLHANPVVRRRREPGDRYPVKHDVVMDGLHTLPQAERAPRRLSAMRERGFAWLERQADKAGFTVREEDVTVDDYQQHRIPRKGRKETMSFSSLDFDGLLEVRDPELFLSGIAHGFGAAKAYGCGLMLIRRA